MKINKRIKISDSIVGQLLYKTDYKCCVCGERGDHIHHLDNNPNNNNLDNLVFLCFTHHDLASLKGSLRKKLTKEAIINYRIHHYQVIEKRRKSELNAFDNHIPIMTEEKLLTVTKTALIILEIENIKTRYFEAEWSKKTEILSELDKYVNHSNNRLAYDILEFLSLVASQTRVGMTESIASSIFVHILNFCPTFYEKQSKKQSIELAKQCINIGESIAYDSFIHLRRINIAMYGLTILKFIYRKAKEKKITELKKEVEKSYDELKIALQRPERNDLADAQEILKIFYDNLEVWDLAFPILSEHLMNRLDIERKEILKKL